MIGVVGGSIAQGAGVTAKDAALIEAARRGDTDSVKALIAAGTDVNAKDKDGKTALMAASNADCVKALIAAGVDVNAKNNNGETALSLAKDHTVRVILRAPN